MLANQLGWLIYLLPLSPRPHFPFGKLSAHNVPPLFRLFDLRWRALTALQIITRESPSEVVAQVHGSQYWKVAEVAVKRGCVPLR